MTSNYRIYQDTHQNIFYIYPDTSCMPYICRCLSDLVTPQPSTPRMNVQGQGTCISSNTDGNGRAWCFEQGHLSIPTTDSVELKHAETLWRRNRSFRQALELFFVTGCHLVTRRVCIKIGMRPPRFNRPKPRPGYLSTKIQAHGRALASAENHETWVFHGSSGRATSNGPISGSTWSNLLCVYFSSESMTEDKGAALMGKLMDMPGSARI